MHNISWLWRGRRRAIHLLVALSFCGGSLFCTAQSAPKHAPDAAWTNDLNKYPGLLPEFAHLLELLQRNVQFPPPRAQSRILPVLPDSTAFYAAFPNYGETSRQALEIFHQQLQESSVLRDWWQHLDPAATKKFEEFAQKFYALSQYLGDEVVISGAAKEKTPDVFFVAEVRKPGLKAFLQQMMATLPPSPKPALRILDPQELATAKDAFGEQPILLVRPDFVIGAGNVASLRSFSARLSQHNTSAFPSTPFGQRINQAYDGGVSIVGAADLHRVLNVIPENNQSKDKQIAFQRSGFADLKYLVWERKSVNGRDLSQAELSFNGPRHGAAAWLAAPRQLGSLDYVSPTALFALGLALKSPAQIFDDIQEMAAASASPGQNQNPLAMAAPMAQMLGINLKDDLLNLLTGELAVEVDSTAPPAPAWRLMLGVNDPAHFQKTLTTLFASSHLEPQQSEEHGVTYYSLNVPSPAKPTEISYAFLDHYLVAASSRNALREAVALHQGGSLAKSQSFLAALPPGHPAGLSALFYEDASALMAMGLAQAAPEIKESLAPMLAAKSPLVVCAYGDDDAIREATTISGFDPTAALVFGAVAIPNLLRARMAANESSAVGTLRTINTAQVAYSATYPQRGFAPNLAMLGPDPAASGTATMNHAGLIDPTLGNPGCTATNWCEKSGYRFRVTAECRQKMCTEFVGVATPVSNNTGVRNFCSTSDGVIRFQMGTPMSSALSASDCRTWQALQ